MGFADYPVFNNESFGLARKPLGGNELRNLFWVVCRTSRNPINPVHLSLSEKDAKLFINFGTNVPTVCKTTQKSFRSSFPPSGFLAKPNDSIVEHPDNLRNHPSSTRRIRSVAESIPSDEERKRIASVHAECSSAGPQEIA